jgi:hypothetical protein
VGLDPGARRSAWLRVQEDLLVCGHRLLDGTHPSLVWKQHLEAAALEEHPERSEADAK